MLGFNKNQNVQPVYNYYVETDLDSFDDQPVDYSKKYSDQDSYDDRRRSKSILKTNQLPPEVSETVCKTCNDEVKVYCIEGTPLTISYASSLSDLREVGTSNVLVKSDDKPSSPPENDSDTPESFDVNIKKTIDSPDSKKEEFVLSKEKNDSKEGKSVSFRTSTDISKASSPLMFSRSSSVDSLTSFDQQSIVDDRSSVSVFSALTSGLISPSDLPDSPGDIMPNTYSDKDSSPKVDVTKIDCDNVLLEKSDKLQETSEEDIDKLSTHVEVSNTKVYLTLNSDRTSEDGNVILNQQLEISDDSLDVDEVFENPDYEDNSFNLQNEDESERLPKSDDESESDDILPQQCIKLGMPNCVKENCSDLHLNKNLDTSPQLQKAEVNEEIIQCEKDLICNEKKKILEYIKEQESSQNLSSKISINSAEKLDLENGDNLKSDDDSDEDDELLQRCIQMGMPQNTSSKIVNCNEEFVKNTSPSHFVSYNPEKVSNRICSSKTEVDSDGDENDPLLHKCIQMGMPAAPSEKKVLKSEILKKTENKPSAFRFHPVNIEPNSINTSNNPHHSDRSKMMNLSSEQYRVPQIFNERVEINNGIVSNKLCSTKADVDSDGDENDPLLQKCIQMGMPQAPSERKVLKSEICKKPENDPAAFMFHPINKPDLKTRDDLKSDDSDEDDELLQRCIQMGMPQSASSKIVNCNKEFVKNTYSSRPECCKPEKIEPNSISKSNNPHYSDGCKIMNLSSVQYRVPQMFNARVRMNNETISNKAFPVKAVMDSNGDESDHLLQKCTQLGMPKAPSERKVLKSEILKKSETKPSAFGFHPINDMRDRCPDGTSDGDEDDDILAKCIRAGMPSPKVTVDRPNRMHPLQSLPTGHTCQKRQNVNRPLLSGSVADPNKKLNPIRLPHNQPYAPIHTSAAWISNTSFIDVDSMRIYRTEDTPILSPTASVSDLSSLSINESFLNNSRNSDCSSASDDDDDDELLLRCIRSGMPENKRAMA